MCRFRLFLCQCSCFLARVLLFFLTLSVSLSLLRASFCSFRVKRFFDSRMREECIIMRSFQVAIRRIFQQAVEINGKQCVVTVGNPKSITFFSVDSKPTILHSYPMISLLSERIVAPLSTYQSLLFVCIISTIRCRSTKRLFYGFLIGQGTIFKHCRIFYSKGCDNLRFK